MSEKERVKQIVEKYDKSFADLMRKGTFQEAKTVVKYFADQSNKKQRKIAGLDN